jgi:hypothetical protein
MSPHTGTRAKGVQPREDRGPDMPADVLEVHVDPVRGRGGELVREVAGPVVDRLVEADPAQVGDLLRAAGDAGRAGAEDLRELSDGAPTGPLAAATTTVSPAFGRPIWVRPAYAVKPGHPGGDDAPPGVPVGVDVVGFVADDRSVAGRLPGDR